MPDRSEVRTLHVAVGGEKDGADADGVIDVTDGQERLEREGYESMRDNARGGTGNVYWVRKDGEGPVYTIGRDGFEKVRGKKLAARLQQEVWRDAERPLAYAPKITGIRRYIPWAIRETVEGRTPAESFANVFRRKPCCVTLQPRKNAHGLRIATQQDDNIGEILQTPIERIALDRGGAVFSTVRGSEIIYLLSDISGGPKFLLEILAALENTAQNRHSPLSGKTLDGEKLNQLREKLRKAAQIQFAAMRCACSNIDQFGYGSWTVDVGLQDTMENVDPIGLTQGLPMLEIEHIFAGFERKKFRAS